MANDFAHNVRRRLKDAIEHLENTSRQMRGRRDKTGADKVDAGIKKIQEAEKHVGDACEPR